MKIINIVVILYIICILFTCAKYTVNGGEGNGSETIARGVIVDSSGIPVSGVKVLLIPFNYNPVTTKLPDSYVGFSDSKGEYCLKNLSAGLYLLEANYSSMDMKALVKNIQITDKENEVIVDTGRLCKTGTVVVNLKDVSYHCGDYLYIPGTTTYAFISSQDSIAGKTALTNVASGTFSDLLYVSVNDTQIIDLIKDSLVVSSGDTVFSLYANWKYFAKIFLNTSPSGANIQDNVYNFPVLLRLNSTFFDFTTAKSKGEDIRFVKSDGTPISYAIERWDTINLKAEIWIKIDTIYGNSSDRWFGIYWGNVNAIDSSNERFVFDTIYGFQGVWHLSDTLRGEVIDASPNKYNGVSADSTFPEIREGIIGNSFWFDGSKTFVICPNTSNSKINFPMKSRYMISAWVYADTLLDIPQTIISKGMYEYFLWLNTGSWQFSEYQDRSGWDMTPQKAILKQWVHLTGMRDGEKQLLYVNGEPVDTIIHLSLSNPRDEASDFIIGRAHDTSTRETSCFFKGAIDEVRILNTIQSKSWIKLCYMNQGPVDKLLIFRGDKR